VESKIEDSCMQETHQNDKDACRITYEEKLPLYGRLSQEAKFVLEHELSKVRIKYHSLIHRVKEFDSLWKKGQRKQKDPFSFGDIVGLRVVCLFISDIERVGNVIKSSFDVISEENKIESEDVASFGYRSVHYDVVLKKTYSGPRYDQISGMRVEIQVRTIAMDAWAAASHYLDYKTDQDIPVALKRDFHALSALFYVADQHFEMFFKSREIAREKAAESFQTPDPNLDQPINLDSLSAYLAQRLPDRKESTSDFLSQLVQELSDSGYNTIKQVDETLDIGWEAFSKYEDENPPGSDPKQKQRFETVGVVRILFDIADDNFRKSRGRAVGSVEKYRPLLKHRPRKGTKWN
jgi:ppGpp synthetase/RelA/SpoT-type nucleotidyltranferase